MSRLTCPGNTVGYNGTLCACPPGHLLDPAGGNVCALFSAASGIATDAGVDTYSAFFPETIFSFDQINKLTQSQAVFLEATLVLLLSWLVFCFFLRFIKLGHDGNNVWFKLRWWISRLDTSFSTRHWLDDEKVVRKRKTELGGTFSIASWILFVGLFAALLYEIISKRSVEVHNVRATNAPDLASFVIDMEINITSISSMTCSNLRHLPTFVTGNPGLVDHRLASLSHFANYSCSNTSKGPTITLSCKNCVLTHDSMYISWHFLDIPNVPASAVGFEFNVTTKSRANTKHVSFVSGVLRNGYGYGYGDDTPVTFRGVDANVLKFSLFPRIYRNLHDLRLVQPLFRDFLPGSSISETSQLRTSLENPRDGVINTTLHIKFLSAYIIEIKNQNIMGPVSFLADLGGLYCISIAIFFYCLVQCEYKVKSLRNEDSVMQQIRNRRKAQQRWSKLRRYVMYTWGCIILDHNRSVRGNGSSHKRRQQSRLDSISFNTKLSLPAVKNTIPENNHHTLEVKSCIATAPNCELLQPSKSYRSSLSSDINPQLPLLELKDSSQMDMSAIQKNLQSLYQYNVMLSDKLVDAQSLLDDLATKSMDCHIS